MEKDASTDSLQTMSSPVDVRDCFSYIESRMETGGSGSEPTENASQSNMQQVLSQREQDLEVAARLGQALLQENQELRAEAQRREEESRKTIEHLEQDKHGLQLRLITISAERDSALSELQGEVRAARSQLQRVARHGAETERGRERQLSSAAAENERLAAQLQQALSSEQKLTQEVLRLRSEVAEKRAALLQQQEQLQQLKLQAEDTERERASLQRELEALKVQREDLHESVQLARDRIQLLEAQHAQLQEQLRTQQDDMDALTFSRDAAHEELQQLVFSSGAAIASQLQSHFRAQQLHLQTNRSHQAVHTLQPTAPSRLFSTDSLEPVNRLFSNDSLEPERLISLDSLDAGRCLAGTPHSSDTTSAHDDYHWDTEPVALQLLHGRELHESAVQGPQQHNLSLAEELAQFDTLRVDDRSEQPMWDSRSPEVDEFPLHVNKPLEPHQSDICGENELRRRGSLQENARLTREERRGVVSMYCPGNSQGINAELLAGHVQYHTLCSAR